MKSSAEAHPFLALALLVEVLAMFAVALFVGVVL